VDDQNQMLNVLDDGIDKNTKQMAKTHNKMTKLIQESSNCCLITTIALEIASLVMIIVLI